MLREQLGSLLGLQRHAAAALERHADHRRPASRPPARGPGRRDTRPTSDRAREALFNILEHGDGAGGAADRGRRVLDVFAGTGALGLEALSRGAAARDLHRQRAARAGRARQHRGARGSRRCPPACWPMRTRRRPGPGAARLRRSLSSSTRQAPASPPPPSPRFAARGWLAPGGGAGRGGEPRAAPIRPPSGFTLLDDRRYGEQGEDPILAKVPDSCPVCGAAARPEYLPERRNPHPLPAGGEMGLSPPPEQPLDVGELQLDVGRPAVVALAGVRRRLHLRAAARSSPRRVSRRPARTEPWQAMVRADRVEPLLRAPAPSPFSASSSARSRTRPRDVDLAEQRRRLAHQHRAGAERLEHQARARPSSSARAASALGVGAGRARPPRGSAAPGARRRRAASAAFMRS